MFGLLVLQQSPATGEGVQTHFTGQQPAAQVELQVCLQLSTLCEAFTTLLAGNCPSLAPGWTPHSPGLLDKVNKAFATLLAGKRHPTGLDC